MEVFILFLIVVAVVISLVPTEEEHVENAKEYRRLTHCEVHEWIQKPSGIEDSTYTVCIKCKFVVETGDYEA